MHPPATGAAEDPAILDALKQWCEGGAWPAMTEALRVACIAPHAGIEAAACELDGSHALARLGRWDGLRWRAQLLWRAQRAVVDPADPWDCGWWRGGPLGVAQAFRPRRPTLLMLREPPPAAAAALIDTLRACSSSYARPVRVLVVSAVWPEGVSRLVR